jgi:hypothetical protein
MSELVLTKAQKRNLRRKNKRLAKHYEATTVTTSVEPLDEKMSIVKAHYVGGPFSPYHPVHNPHGDKTIPYKNPQDPITVVAKGKVKFTKDSATIRMLQLPPLLRPTATHLAATRQDDKFIAFLDQYKNLAPAEDTKEQVKLLLNKTVEITVDDL